MGDSSIKAKALLATTLTAGNLTFASVCGSIQGLDRFCTYAQSLDTFLVILLAMQALDMVSGVLASRLAGERIKSARFSVGARKKFGMLLVLAGTVLVDGIFRAHGLTAAGVFYQWTASWFIATEFISLYENAARMGLPLPKALRQAMEFLLERAERSFPGGNERETVGDSKQLRLTKTDAQVTL